MSKVLIVYWSGTGNTQIMADTVAQGAKIAGAEVNLLAVSNASDDLIAEYDHIAFGCPSMGSEVLEEMEMEPFFTAAEAKLSGKKIALFGSYDWGDGQWMRDWEDRVRNAGATLCQDAGVIHRGTPDTDSLVAYAKLGSELANL